MQRLTKEQAIILTGATGTMVLDDFSIFHADVEKRLGRPVFTHEFPSISDEIKKAYADDFKKLVYVGENE